MSDDTVGRSAIPQVASRPAAVALVSAILAFGLVLAVPVAEAKQKFMSGFAEAYPEAAGTSLNSCLLCHTDPSRPREENLNSYGEDWEDVGDKDYLAPALVNRDSDGDGVSNGEEIRQLSLPGDPSSSTPPTTTTTLPGTPPNGQALYSARCEACHGPDGGDLTGTGLSRSAFISITIDGQGGMPAQANLTNEEAGAIWDFVTGVVPPTTTTTQPGATTTTTMARSGPAVYAASCAVCHGTEGGNLQGHTLTLSQIVAFTTNGVGTMGGYAGKLSTAEISNVSQYVLSVGAGAGVTTTTAPPNGQVSGANLYMQHCSACHGLHGEGGPGGAVAGTTLARSQIISVTTEGTSGMLGYGSKLSSIEIEAVADHILGMSGAPSDPEGAGAGENGTADTAVPPELAEGHALYVEFCALCHGLHGEGGPGGPVAGVEMSAIELDEIIRSGVGSMPGYGDQMSDSEIEALVAYSEALAAGQSFDGTSTTTQPVEETLAAEAPVFVADGDAAGTEGTPTGMYVVIAVGVLIAGSLVFFWMRSARKLFG